MEKDVLFNPILEHGNLLIIGNGFDLDLGFKTGYKDFVNNENSDDCGAFPFARGAVIHSKLGKYIQSTTFIKEWYDLENILAEYGKEVESPSFDIDFLGVRINASKIVSDTADILTQKNKVENDANDKHDYYKLVESLSLYLKSIDLCKPNTDSIAARLLRALYKNPASPAPNLYSFNYTDLQVIGCALGLSVGEVNHIHGCLKNDNIILGVGDYVDLRDEVDYMYKTSNMSYQSTRLFEALEECDNIFIFGLSLSQVDYPYFATFFKNLASGGFGHVKKFVRIFTYDNESRAAILRNLRRMNNGMIDLMNRCDLDIIRTKDNVDESKVVSILEKIETEGDFDSDKTHFHF